MSSIIAESVIFDMDGTLWDAVDSYRQVWDATFDEFDVPRRVTREELISYMGQPIDVIFAGIGADLTRQMDRDEFLRRLDDNERTMMPLLGGRLYPGVADGIRQLAAAKRLFMVSNCGAEGLHNFVRVTGLAPYFTDTRSHGQTGLPKEGNIRCLIEEYGLQKPIYMGDTASDIRSAHAAGIPVIWAAYGFGQGDGADFKADTFADAVSQLL